MAGLLEKYGGGCTTDAHRSPDFRESLGVCVMITNQPNRVHLTDKDIEVLDLIAEGLDYNGIAMRTGVSRSAINVRVSEVSKRIGLPNHRGNKDVLLKWLSENGWEVECLQYRDLSVA